VPLLLLAVVTHKAVFGLYLQLYQLHILGVLLLVLVHLGGQAWRGNSLARWCLIAFGLVAFGAVNDILHSVDIIETAHIAPYTMIGFVLMQAGILSARNAAIARERDALNATKLEVLQKSEEAARIKSEFLANMSHELRTPLNALCNIPRVLIGNFQEVSVWECPQCRSHYEDDGSIASDEDAPDCPDCTGFKVQRTIQRSYQGDEDEHHHYLHQVDQQAQSLLGLIERVLTFNDLQEDGGARLTTEPVELRTAFTGLFDHYKTKAEQRFLSFDVAFEGDIDIVQVDQQKVEQCLDLLIDNALKFTGHYGEISCTVRAISNNHLQIDVKDTGIGIASSDVSDIFTAFYQVESSHTREFGGAGLGLALVKELTEAHHGSVAVESTLGEGATFFLHFKSL
jgi:signal transduction histidine kinase